MYGLYGFKNEPFKNEPKFIDVKILKIDLVLAIKSRKKIYRKNSKQMSRFRWNYISLQFLLTGHIRFYNGPDLACRPPIKNPCTRLNDSLYNNVTSVCIFIGSRQWSIKGHMHRLASNPCQWTCFLVFRPKKSLNKQFQFLMYI